MLDVFFNPKSVAVFGVSRFPDKPGRVIFDNIIKGGYEGEVYPVNPKAEEIAGRKIYKVEELPDFDLGIFVIPAPIVPKAMESVAERMRAALIIGGGFGEVGRKDLDEALLRIKEEYGIRIWGPNCLGLINAHAKFNATFIPLERMDMPKSGGISLLSQSGATVASIVDWANSISMGIAKVASYGNQLDVSDYEILDYFNRDEQTKVIGFYVEGLKDGRKMLEVGKKLRKPVIAFKAGRSEKGRKAARSHTGALAGNYSIYRGVFKQMGFGEADSLEDFINALQILEKWRKVGNRVGIITCGGGFGVMASDAVEFSGMRIAEFDVSKLRNQFPERVVLSNPLDLTGDATPEMFEKAIKEVSKQVDALIVIFLFQLPRLNEKSAEIVNIDKPIVVVSPPGKFASLVNKKFKVPVVSTPEKAAKALSIAYMASRKFKR